MAQKKSVKKSTKKSKKKAAKNSAKKGTKKVTKNGAKRKSTSGNSKKVVLLSGGNPQIPKGEGDAPVKAYIAAMPGWKRSLGRRMDEIVERTVPGVQKAVKWNSPFYGIKDNGWFISYHCFNKYVKVTFFRGTSLKPVPEGTSKHPEVRYLDIYEDQFDETQFTDWVKQASQLPGEKL